MGQIPAGLPLAMGRDGVGVDKDAAGTGRDGQGGSRDGQEQELRDWYVLQWAGREQEWSRDEWEGQDGAWMGRNGRSRQ